MQRNRVLLLAVLAFAPAMAMSARADLIVSGNIRSQAVGPNFDYTITLTNSALSTESIRTFWYAWIPGQDYLATSPLAFGQPSGWTGTITHVPNVATNGYAIQWVTSTAPIAPGSSADFTFRSADAPSSVNGLSIFYPSTPVGTSFVYSGAPFQGTARQFIVTPEPSSLVLGGIALAVGGTTWERATDDRPKAELGRAPEVGRTPRRNVAPFSSRSARSAGNAAGHRAAKEHHQGDSLPSGPRRATAAAACSATQWVTVARGWAVVRPRGVPTDGGAGRPPGIASRRAVDHARAVVVAESAEFLKQGTMGLGLAGMAVPLVHAGGGEAEIVIGVIGCGGRGTGAAFDALGAATKVIYPAEGYHTEDVADGARVEHKNIRVAALADLFPDRLARCRGELAKIGVKLDNDRCFHGFDAYEKVLAIPEINYVILATPPHFRPAHLEAAIRAGKNAFVEKPVAVDAPGVRRVLAAGEMATQRKLGIAAGTQRRHQKSYRETIARIHDGAIGEIVYAKCYWDGGQIWVIDREPGWSDLEWQLRNWNYFTWLSGDHYVEQHVHNLDVINWALGQHPIRAVSGLGGRQVRVGDRHGHVFDHFAVEFEYPNGVTVFSQARQINGCQNIVAEAVIGSRGTSNCADRVEVKGGEKWRFRGTSPNPYQQEHQDLIASILEGKPINEAKAIAESTLTGILGREAAYSGQAVTWDEAMKSDRRLGPPEYKFGPYPIPPVATPGEYRFG
ncbi:MAG: Gfo/Idh/MocA family oxidoreductase [Isosphaeraceae bacterium]